MSKRLISFDLQADFGCLKKPDVNDGLMLSFNMLHKPALLGILGAVIGLRGYTQKGQLPEYYTVLKNIPLSIEPIGDDKGNFIKTAIKYTNTVGYANADGGTLIVHEQTLIAPAYRIYLLLDLTDEVQAHLYKNLKANEAVYLPYIGKNECSAWFEDYDTEGERFREYEYSNFTATQPFKVTSLFVRKYPLKDNKQEPKLSFATQSVLYASNFAYFERLPLRFDETLLQYELAEFAYSNWFYKPDSTIESLVQIRQNEADKVIQLF